MLRDKPHAYYAGWITFLLSLVSFGIAILTPPLSGPLCRKDCFDYPFLDIAHRFPRDYYWMMTAIPQYIAFVFLLVGIHQGAPDAKKSWTLTALNFGTLAAGILIVTYFTQLAVIQPSLIRGESDGISLLSQYNPHGLFIALEEIGYLLLLLSLFCVGPAFADLGRLGGQMRWLLQFGFVAVIAVFAAILARKGHEREYLFEIAVISVSYLLLALTAIATATIFSRRKLE